ncbi:hypothetical protein QTI05_22510 [Variovorax sp. J22R193]|uniref:hypothetical protein n=1 Tax=Variovorax fucosicus TaxID=3053517 RepID=UPI002574D7DF|nr:hypothetical protein [Variovorax sp. J22R193]MDM0041830.1 hypothetical protein [Variovorax sp. J22R193]
MTNPNPPQPTAGAQEAALRALKDVKFDKSYCCLKERTREAVEAALATPTPPQQGAPEASAAPVQEEAREPWLLYLSDRADGVKGRYAIARWNPAGYREVWNLRRHRWSSASDDVLTLEEAHALLKTVTLAAPQPVPAPREQDAVGMGAEPQEIGELREGLGQIAVRVMDNPVMLKCCHLIDARLAAMLATPTTAPKQAEPASPVLPAGEATDEELNAVIQAQWGEQIGVMVQAHRAFARAVLALRNGGRL